MPSFRSHEELFQAVTDLIAALENGGHATAASELREGFSCLNGLTDGWALFLDAIERVEAGQAKGLAKDQKEALEKIRKDVHRAVYRR